MWAPPPNNDRRLVAFGVWPRSGAPTPGSASEAGKGTLFIRVLII